METIAIQSKEHVFEITISRPKALNALSETVLKELLQAFEQIESKHRVVVLKGAGEKAFVAGADIAAMAKLDPQQAAEFCALGQRVTTSLESMAQTCVAVVDGFALGGGCELVLACDLVIASEEARFGQPETLLGLIPGFGGTQRLVRRIGRAKTMYLLTTGKHLSGAQALEAGLVSLCVSKEKLEETVAKTVASILKSPLSALGPTKQLTLQAEYKDLQSGLNAEKAAFSELFSGQEAKEGMTAFLEKRAPNFAAKP
jgi:enoyl-CoA hydratase